MTREEIFNVIKANMELIIESSRGQPITESQSLRDYAADSLEVLEVVSRSMKQLRIKIQLTDLAGDKRIQDLVDIFQRAATNSVGRP